jgi:hypothetical protein
MAQMKKKKAARYGLRAAVPWICEIRAALRAVTRLLHRFDALNVSPLHPQWERPQEARRSWQRGALAPLMSTPQAAAIGSVHSVSAGQHQLSMDLGNRAEVAGSLNSIDRLVVT